MEDYLRGLRTFKGLLRGRGRGRGRPHSYEREVFCKILNLYEEKVRKFFA